MHRSLLNWDQIRKCKSGISGQQGQSYTPLQPGTQWILIFEYLDLAGKLVEWWVDALDKLVMQISRYR